ncbi:hypothetical protein GSI_03441 [Ganoderma sinense ZZ0214-1]|uniref:Uncharacterized protein n=1 Tax=Ganoderma sinense ZZ0214-1 TaxID=1077348 RepID=A0A2G8SLM7_9APHY|nr:hypothetical protein GSI_03441 [Ganoderma sinense ZZ0214-1]
MAGAAIDMVPREEGSQTSESVTGTEELECPPVERRIIIQRISRQLIELDREDPTTESNNRKRLELKRLWNNALLIHTLPDEVLTQIFDSFQASLRTSSPKLSSSHSTSRGSARPITARHGLMLVCSHWCNLLVSTPAFWRIVDTKRRVEWMRLCLRRSAGASLDVHARVQDRYALDMLYPQVHRFRKLFSSAGLSKPQIQAALPPLLGGGMPLLEYLDFSISLAIGQRRPNADLSSYLTSQQFPRLQTLHLARVISPRDKPLYAQLRTLYLLRCFHSVSFDDFLDALAGCAQLEELTLDNTLHSLSGEWTAQLGTGTIPHRQPITLPSLCELRLDENASSIIPYFLAHLRIPVSTSLRFTSDFHLDADGGGSLDPAGKTLSALLPPNPATTLPILSTTTRLATTFMPGQWRTWAHGQPQTRSPSDLGPGPAGSPGRTRTPSPSRDQWQSQESLSASFPAVFTLFSKSEMGLAEDPWVGRGLGDLVECFGGSPLTALEVDEHTSAGCTSVAGWEGVFRTFSRLEELTLHCSASRVELSTAFLGLHAASAGPGVSEDSLAPVACPRLAHVSADGWGTAATYEAMRRCFRRRAERGAWLEVLHLRHLFDGEDLTAEERRGFVEDLRQVVRLVKHN